VVVFPSTFASIVVIVVVIDTVVIDIDTVNIAASSVSRCGSCWCGCYGLGTLSHARRGNCSLALLFMFMFVFMFMFMLFGLFPERFLVPRFSSTSSRCCSNLPHDRFCCV